jgi:hypothetical protein
MDVVIATHFSLLMQNDLSPAGDFSDVADSLLSDARHHSCSDARYDIER